MPTEDIPRSWALNLPERGLTLHAPEQRTLLQTLQAAGVPWPASCRNGTCRTCIGRLTAGRVRYGVDWPGLLPEEKTAGAVLPCVAYPVCDVRLENPVD